MARSFTNLTHTEAEVRAVRNRRSRWSRPVSLIGSRAVPKGVCPALFHRRLQTQLHGSRYRAAGPPRGDGPRAPVRERVPRTGDHRYARKLRREALERGQPIDGGATVTYGPSDGPCREAHIRAVALSPTRSTAAAGGFSAPPAAAAAARCTW
jgi:hypothetical protein